MTINEQLAAIDRLNARCRTAILAGDTELAWALWDQATEAMKELLGMETRDQRVARLHDESQRRPYGGKSDLTRGARE